MSRKIYRIKVLKYQKWQSKINSGVRSKFFIDRNFCSDEKIGFLVKNDPLCVILFLHLIGKCEYDRPYWEVEEGLLREDIRRALRADSNRFNYMGKLIKLQSQKLIEIEIDGKAMPLPNKINYKVCQKKQQKPIEEYVEKPTNKTARRYSADAHELTKELQHRMKVLGMPGWDDKTYYSNVSKSEKLLETTEFYELLNAMDWLLDHEFYGVKITNMHDISIYYPKYLRTKNELPNTKPAYIIDYNGEYTNSSNGDDPGNDNSIPDEKLCVQSLRLRVEHQYFQELKPNPEFYDHPVLKLYLKKYERDFPGLGKEKWPEAYEALESNG